MKNNQLLLLDTNTLISAATGTRLYEEIERHHPEKTPTIVAGSIRELKKIMEQPGKTGRTAKLALQLAEQQHLNILQKSNRYVDMDLLESAKETGATIITLDRELQKQALKQGTPVWTIAKRTVLQPVNS